MAEYIYFTDEQKRRANSVDLVDFLRRQGEQLTRSGRDWRWKRHDSVTLRGNQWFRHSRKEGGLAIDFVREFFGLSFPEAVRLLLGGEAGVEWNQTHKSALPPRKPFALPEMNSDMRRVYAYLIKQRFIDRDVITHFAKAKILYESRELSRDKIKEYHNAVFVGHDENGVPKHAHKRGIYTMGVSYRGNVEGSDPKYSFHHIGDGDTLYVFEAPIDMLSFITLYPKDWKQNSYVALDGVAEHAMLCQLALNPHLQKVVLCLDHDEAGIEATGRLTEILREHGYPQVSVLQPEYKDWNECLKARNGIAPIPAQEHPKLEALAIVCGELREVCEYQKSAHQPHDMLLEHYEKLKSLISNGKLAQVKESAVTEYLQGIAASALLAVQRQYRQMEQPVTIERLIEELQAGFLPHQNRGRLRSKADDLRHDISRLNKQYHTPGIRGPEDKQNLIASYLRLALDCVRTWIFLNLERQKQSEVQINPAEKLNMIM
ncbi:MAG: DUF3991 domain-containing protein [Nitrospiraceae bacterium]|nr:MAG: DUF3991 domain-containing protein [Nitrospiraceae bacterium]